MNKRNKRYRGIRDIRVDVSNGGAKSSTLDKNVLIFSTMNPKLKRPSHLPIICGR